MDLRSLEEFVVLSKVRSFSKAAEMLYLTQPVLSRRIAALESEVGQTLIVRSKPAIGLTPAGEYYLKQAEEMLALYGKARSGLQEHVEGRQGKLEIGYVNISQFTMLCEAARALREKLPGVELSVCRHPVPRLYEMLNQGQLDVIFDRCSPPRRTGLLYRDLPEGPLYAVLYRGHPLSAREEILMEDLRDERFVIFERETAPEAFDYETQLCLAHGFTMNIVAYGENLEEVMLQVGVGMGIALMDHAGRVLETPHTRFIPVRDAHLPTCWRVIWRGDNVNPCVGEFLKAVTTGPAPDTGHN